jgi:ABC-type uncharacterized transport system substrate-binding protein
MVKILSILLFCEIVFAHPHIFIDLYLDFSKQNVVNVKWAFDDMTSSMFMVDFDQDGDGKFNKKETSQFIEYVVNVEWSKKFKAYLEAIQRLLSLLTATQYTSSE